MTEVTAFDLPFFGTLYSLFIFPVFPVWSGHFTIARPPLHFCNLTSLSSCSAVSTNCANDSSYPLAFTIYFILSSRNPHRNEPFTNSETSIVSPSTAFGLTYSILALASIIKSLPILFILKLDCATVSFILCLVVKVLQHSIQESF